MADAFDIASVIREHRASLKSGSLTFWGRWFGKPFDNIHTIAGCATFDDLLVIYFDCGERLWLWNPAEPLIGPNTFRIGRASRLRWEWYDYGLPPTQEALSQLEFDGPEVGATPEEGAQPDVAFEIH